MLIRFSWIFPYILSIFGILHFSKAPNLNCQLTGCSDTASTIIAPSLTVHVGPQRHNSTNVRDAGFVHPEMWVSQEKWWFGWLMMVYDGLWWLIMVISEDQLTVCYRTWPFGSFIYPGKLWWFILANGTRLPEGNPTVSYGTGMKKWPIHMEVSWNGSTPIAGRFISWKIPI